MCSHFSQYVYQDLIGDDVILMNLKYGLFSITIFANKSISIYTLVRHRYQLSTCDQRPLFALCMGSARDQP